MSRPTPVQLWACRSGVCPPKLHPDDCRHGSLVQTTYIPISTAEELVQTACDRILAACNEFDRRQHLGVAS